jgi:CDP-glucose 4,6-dehydratase
VRNPAAIRPWQHVLNALGGYLMLAEALAGDRWAARAWNFGPPAGDERPVSWILEVLCALWDGGLCWEADGREHPREAPHLALDSTDAGERLQWRPPWDLERALELIVGWHRAERAGEGMRAVSLAQIGAFEAAAAGAPGVVRRP